MAIGLVILALGLVGALLRFSDGFLPIWTYLLLPRLCRRQQFLLPTLFTPPILHLLPWVSLCRRRVSSASGCPLAGNGCPRLRQTPTPFNW
jgi:hypothetical protein